MVKGVEVEFNNRKVLKDFNMDAYDKDLVVVVGASGKGKTTLLKVISGLLRPGDEGWVGGDVSMKVKDGFCDVTDLPPQQRPVGMVMQTFPLYPGMSARGNIEFPLRIAGENPRSGPARKKITGAIEDAGLGSVAVSKLDGPTDSLSGGEKQRVALARMLVRNPRIALLDESLANLDVGLRQELWETIRKLVDSGDQPQCVVLVTHGLAPVVSATTLVVLGDPNGDGTTDHEVIYTINGERPWQRLLSSPKSMDPVTQHWYKAARQEIGELTREDLQGAT